MLVRCFLFVFEMPIIFFMKKNKIKNCPDNLNNYTTLVNWLCKDQILDRIGNNW